MKTVLVADNNGRPGRLRELGLDEELLLQAVQRGQSAWANCTLNHPPLYRGIAAWAETTCALREALIPLGWKRSDEGNLPITINGAGSLAITAATGDDYTGREDGSPCTRSSKGPRTAEAVTGNSLAQTLFGDIRLRPSDLQRINTRMTWMLLFARDIAREEVRSELSLPSKMNVEGVVDGWLERIILGTLPLGSDSVKAPAGALHTPVIEIEVKRRGA